MANMTVCIAAVAEATNAIVLVADRAIAYQQNGHTTFKADEGTKKIRDICDGWVGLISGRIDFGESVLFAAEAQYRASRRAGDSPAMSLCTKVAYQEARNALVVDAILKPKLLSKEWYAEKLSKPTPREDDFFQKLVKEIDEFFVDTGIMLCGFEEDVDHSSPSAEIYTITSPGILSGAASDAVCAMGIGQETALSRLFALETDPFDPLAKVLYDAYDAKEACADFVPDVGRQWDAAILVAGKPPIAVPEEIQSIVEAIYKSHPRSPFHKPDGEPPENWNNRLLDFSRQILNRDESTRYALVRTNRGREDQPI